MVQLSDELVVALDREARQAGLSRSAVIREAVVAHLAQRRQPDQVLRYVEGYRRQPPAVPDAWGDVERDGDAQGHDLAQRLDDEERAAGLSW